MGESLGQSGFLLQALVAFGGGLVSFLSPCVLPLLPGYLAMMTGYSTEEITGGNVAWTAMVGKILQFIAGFTLVFAALGAGASSISAVLRRNLSELTRLSGALVVVMGLLIVALAISNRGPLATLGRERRFNVRPSRLGRWAAPVMGMAFAFGWTACIGPILTVILTTAATQETLGRGVALLISYSLGLGIPFLAAGLGVAGLFSRIKPWLRPLNIASGLALAGFGLAMFTGELSSWSSWLAQVFSGVPFLSDLATI